MYKPWNLGTSRQVLQHDYGQGSMHNVIHIAVWLPVTRRNKAPAIMQPTIFLKSAGVFQPCVPIRS